MPIISMPQMWSVVLSAIVAAVDPTKGFIVAILIAGFFNIWCGMRSDGVTIINCKKFRWSKFKNALAELFMLLCVVEMIAIICHSMGDEEIKVYACKVVGWFIVYCYLVNGLKNLCKAYPKSKALWLIYLFIHLDFRRFIHIDEIMEKYENHLNNNYGTDRKNVV